VRGQSNSDAGGRDDSDAQLAFVYQDLRNSVCHIGARHAGNGLELWGLDCGRIVAADRRADRRHALAIHRELALRIKSDMIGNWRTIQRIRVALQVSLLLLILEILAWLLSIGGF